MLSLGMGLGMSQRHASGAAFALAPNFTSLPFRTFDLACSLGDPGEFADANGSETDGFDLITGYEGRGCKGLMGVNEDVSGTGINTTRKYGGLKRRGMTAENYDYASCRLPTSLFTANGLQVMVGVVLYLDQEASAAGYSRTFVVKADTDPDGAGFDTFIVQFRVVDGLLDIRTASGAASYDEVTGLDYANKPIFLGFIWEDANPDGSGMRKFRGVYSLDMSTLTILDGYNVDYPVFAQQNVFFQHRRTSTPSAAVGGVASCLSVWNTTFDLGAAAGDPKGDITGHSFPTDFSTNFGPIEIEVASAAELHAAYRCGQALSLNASATMFKTSGGANNSFADMANVAAQKLVDDAYYADSDYLVPQGDTITLGAGEYFLVEEPFVANLDGINIVIPEDANVYLDKLISPDWEAVVGFDNVWQTTTTALALQNTHLMYKDGSAWKFLEPELTDTLEDAKSALDNNPGRYHTYVADSGRIYVRLPNDEDPNDYDFRVCADYLTTDGYGGFFFKNGRLVLNGKIRGGTQYRTSNDGQTFAHYHAGFCSSALPRLTVIDCGENGAMQEYGIHALGFTGTHEKCMVIAKGCTSKFGPIAPYIYWFPYVINPTREDRLADGQGWSIFYSDITDRPNIGVAGSSAGDYDPAAQSFDLHAGDAPNTGANSIAFIRFRGFDLVLDAEELDTLFDGNPLIQDYEVVE